ncbi:hypothetical protein GCM10023322_79160 [Rugosimonospora acidiphila]|uniref:Uncharacterized protein n=1 Tax=Rugosimonospora acidiphila TaxID=556531 RepID=A0ABP9SQA8_9ACTN
MSKSIDTPGGDQASHDCQTAGTLTYRGDYGAPGFGQAWRCTACGKAWSRLGNVFQPEECGAHILTIHDVE